MYTNKHCRSDCKVKVFEKTFNTSEQAYGYQKAVYHNQQEKARAILEASDPWKYLRIHTTIETADDWERDKEDYMLEILRAKYQGCDGYRSFLENCKDSEFLQFEFREDTNHLYWGGRHGGLNRQGELHAKVRDDPPSYTSPVLSKSAMHSTKKNDRHNAQPLSGTSMVNDSTEIRNHIKDDVFIITDSLGSNMNGRLMYKKARCSVKRLRYKTIADAAQYTSKVEISSKAIVYVVGTNDLVHKSAEDTSQEAKFFHAKKIFTSFSSHLPSLLSINSLQ